MSITLIVTILLIVLLGASVISGAPYLPTRRKYAEKALDLMKLEEGDLVVDLGSGDGSVLVAASRRGYRALGYEINPILVFVSKLRLLRYKDSKVVWGDMWGKQLPKETKGVFLFLIPYLMKDMEIKLKEELDGVPVVTYAFEFPNKKPRKTDVPLFMYRF